SDTTSSECCSSSSAASAVEEEKRKRWRANATFIDPTRRGNLARFINHSCDPNLRLIPVRIGTPLVHIGLFACRTIEPLEELTYDYGKGESNVNLIQLPCHCDSKNCRRFLPASASAIS
ncbi:unnamed protein product, partial [Anisakis simplex]|uniref:Histone-lysine N-methyltransferase n=1 Tax=Anisakis simplex TaxID=6269 RepID=A0A0M3KH86_ANISI